MPLAERHALLRPGLLDGVRIVLAGASGEAGFSSHVQKLCVGLGASTGRLDIVVEGSPEEREKTIDAAVGATLAELGGAELLVVDCAGMFEHRPPEWALIESMQASWDVTRSLANRAFIPESAGGRIVLLAPPSAHGSGHAVATTSGLENLARTLSVEWARYGIRTVAIAPGPGTAKEQVAAICAWLASPAGDYFSGCLMDLTGP